MEHSSILWIDSLALHGNVAAKDLYQALGVVFAVTHKSNPFSAVYFRGKSKLVYTNRPEVAWITPGLALWIPSVAALFHEGLGYT